MMSDNLDDLKLAAFEAHQRYLQSVERGDKLEMIRLWVAFMHAIKAVSKAKEESQCPPGI